MKLVILITAQVEHGFEVATAWQTAGAPGVTILRSYGLHTLQTQLRKGEVELPRMVVSMASALARIFDEAEEEGLTFLSLVENDQVDQLVAAANGVLGDLTQPGNGILFVLDVERAIGVRFHH